MALSSVCAGSEISISDLPRSLDVRHVTVRETPPDVIYCSPCKNLKRQSVIVIINAVTAKCCQNDR